MTGARIREAAIWTVLVFILVLPCLLGAASSVGALLFTLGLAVPLLRQPGAWDAIRREPAMVLFVAAFVILTLSFAVTARQPADVRFAANFLGLLLAPVVFLFSRERPANDIALVLTLALVGSGAGALVAITDTLLLGLPRAQGLFGGPNLLPRVAIPLGFVAMAGVLLVPGRNRYYFYLGPAFAMLATLLSASRGAALALPPLLILASIVLWRRGETRRDMVALAVVALVAIAGVWLLQPGAAVRIGTTLASIGDVIGGDASTDVATYERQAMLSAGWTAFQTAPLLGYGWANLGAAAALAYPAGFGQLATSNSFMFHNDALDFAVAAGVAGIAVWLLLLVTPIIGAIAGPRDELRPLRTYGALVLSLSFLVFGVTDMTFGYDLTTTLYAFLTALLFGARVRR